ncbi:MAG: PIN domain-containing protein [Solirubrobacteraceae bacterium]|nr:PIN domain-containing protein [Solirubrobacteraceae bacterium]
MIFVDASVLLASEDRDDPHFQAAQALLNQERRFAALDLTVYEVTNVARAQWQDAAACRRLQQRCWLIAESGALARIDPELANTAASLVHEHGLTAYDAAYVAAAGRLGATLVSCDVKDLVGPGFAVLPGDV